MEQYLSKANAGISREFTPEQAESRMSTFKDPETIAQYYEKIDQLWRAADINQNAYLDQIEYQMFIKFLYHYNEAKHGGRETISDELVIEGFQLIRQIWGDEEVNGITMG